MTVEEALEFLEALTDFERLGFHRHFAQTVGLDSARELLLALGHPERAVPAVHIAGTKGKGSTAAMVERVLRQAGYRTGLFTSPHLVSFRERIRIDGEPIPQQALADCVALAKSAYEQVQSRSDLTPCTFFEVYLAVAALNFLRENVDIAIYETGLGGRLDATNLIVPLVAAVTSIGFDHTYILGETLDAIAREKAEISKPDVPLVVARGQADEAMRAIEEIARKNGTEVTLAPVVARREPPEKAALAPGDVLVWPHDRFETDSRSLGQVDCSLLGAHQAANLGVAFGILESLGSRGYTVGNEDLKAGLLNINWPGRFDIRDVRPWLVFDCAHNPESARTLARALPEYLDFDTLALVVGMSGDKDVEGFAQFLAPLGPRVVLTQATTERALPVKELAQRAARAWADVRVVPDVAEACARARELAGPEGAVCVTGSFYVVGEAMQALGIEP